MRLSLLCVFVNPRVFIFVHTCAYMSVYIGMQIPRARAWVHTHVCAHMLLRCEHVCILVGVAMTSL